MGQRLPFEEVEKVRAVVCGGADVVNVIFVKAFGVGQNLLNAFIIDRFFEYVELIYFVWFYAGYVDEVEAAFFSEPAGFGDLVT